MQTLKNVRDAGMKVCAGGIVGMGESVRDWAALSVSPVNLPKHPESVPINMLVKVQGTPFEALEDLAAGVCAYHRGGTYFNAAIPCALIRRS